MSKLFCRPFVVFVATVACVAVTTGASAQTNNPDPNETQMAAGDAETGDVDEAAPEAEPTDTGNLPTELYETDGLMLTELVVSQGVESREPINPNTVFRLGEFERLYAFFKVKNPEATEDAVTVSWSPADGTERGTVSVSVGAQKQWRTWAFTRTIKKVGKWQVIVKDSSGTVLGRSVFEITDGASL